MIRLANVDDVHTIVNNILTGHKETNSDYWKDKHACVNHLVDNVSGVIDQGRSYVSTRGHILCYVGCHFFETGSFVYVPSLFVHKEYRDTGHAVRLIRKAEEVVKATGSKALFLGESSGIRTTETTNLYKRMGFEQYGTEYVKEI